MKVYELIGEGLKYTNDSDKERIVNNLIDNMLVGIDHEIIHTNSIDETIKLKKVREDLDQLRFRYFKIDSILDKEVKEAFKFN